MRYKKEQTGIYAIYHGNECLYVGRGKEIADRKSYHWCRLKHNNHTNSKLQELWNTNDGEHNFEFKVIENCCIKDFQEREQYWIDTLTPSCNKIKASISQYNTNTYRKNKIKAHRSEINSGINNPRCKHSEEEIKQIKQMILFGYETKDIAQITHCCKSLISAIRNGVVWVNVKLNEDEINQIRTTVGSSFFIK